MNLVDSRGESPNEIRDRYEQLRAEVQVRRRKHPTCGRAAPSWRRPGAGSIRHWSASGLSARTGPRRPAWFPREVQGARSALRRVSACRHPERAPRSDPTHLSATERPPPERNVTRREGNVMRPAISVGLLFLTLSQVACGGQRPAASPTSTATATPASTPSPTPSPIPTPTPSPSPTPGPTVLGNLQIGFIPATTNVEPPSPPIEVSIVIKPADGGPDVKQPITESGGGFSLTLDPGTYRLYLLEILAPSMSDQAFQVPTIGPTFTVPATGCVYVGRIYFEYYRMPKGSLDEQTAAIKQQFRRDDLSFVFLESGSLVGTEASVSLSPEGDRVSGSDNCSVTPADY